MKQLVESKEPLFLTVYSKILNNIKRTKYN